MWGIPIIHQHRCRDRAEGTVASVAHVLMHVRHLLHTQVRIRLLGCIGTEHGLITQRHHHQQDADEEQGDHEADGKTRTKIESVGDFVTHLIRRTADGSAIVEPLK